MTRHIKIWQRLLIWQLQQENKLDLEKPVSYYLRGLVTNDSIFDNITIKELASHRSGLPRIPANYDKVEGYEMMQPYRMYKRENLYQYLSSLKKMKQGNYDYSNLGFGLLGTFAEIVCEKSLEELFIKYIFSPLEMNDSYLTNKRTSADSATGFFYGKPADYWIFDCLAGCGGVKTNANDMLIYLDAHLNTLNSKFSQAVGRITEPVDSVQQNMKICYGWHTLEDLQHRVYWHNGGTYGFSTFAAFDPVEKTSLILASNSFQVNTSLDKLGHDLLLILTRK